ncbi:MAG: Gfo/Idh/MocA family oxidoreductase [Gemmataceae bacterium]|nr:Gfo/Idh/MocA family oxidoreductase [Gemmataceae bacterium]MCI0737665.1 Gfo/Idh/MocA family oxidoreductase [Gemmataceae bacterium]
MPTPLNAAVVGTGFIGPVHIEALRRLNIPVVGVLGSSPEKSSNRAATLGVPRGYASFDELLADADAHVVHITSPNRFHYEQCRRALTAGKHVLCEKPLAMNASESADLVALAEKTKSVAAVCYNIRFYPLCLEMKERIAAGELGEIYHVTGSYVQDWLLYDTDFNWRVLAEEGGALRAVADIGTHWLDLVQSVTGLEVEEVCADLKTILPTRRKPKGSVETFQNKFNSAPATEPVAITTEDYGSVLLRFRGGARGVTAVSQVSAGRKNCVRLEIAGAKGALAWNSERPNELWFGRRDRPNELLVRDPALLSPSARRFTTYPGGHNEGFPDTFKQLFRAVYDFARKGDYQSPPNFPTFADGHREIVLCKAILQSHRQERWVKMEHHSG